jgi:diguanylate cyclase (GGDEF)-like protein/PAS domain S-box-containing protein
VSFTQVDTDTAFDMLSAAFESTPVGMAFLSLDREILRVNGAICAILGRTEEELRSRGLGALTHPDDRTLHADLHRQLLSGEIDRYQLDKRYIHSDGRTVWTTLHVGLVRDRDGQPVCLISQVHDITERVEATERVRWLAMHDSLTGLGNRALLFDRLTHACESGDLASVLYADLDEFKRVNDTYGHESGDTLLKEVARRIETVMRRSDTITRVGGDEFAAVLARSTTASQARKVAEKIRSVAGKPVALGATMLLISFSIGVAVGRDLAADELLRQADDALYKAKRSGRNRVCVYGGSC